MVNFSYDGHLGRGTQKLVRAGFNARANAVKMKVARLSKYQFLGLNLFNTIFSL